jgi:hypothetical protein
VQATVVAFRVGVCVSRMKERLIISPEEMSRTWSMMVAGPSAADAVLKYREESVSQSYLSLLLSTLKGKKKTKEKRKTKGKKLTARLCGTYYLSHCR